MGKLKRAVFTCITGNYDVLRDIRREPGFDYICFTNNRLLRSETWKVVFIDEDLDNRLLQRKVKILGYRYLPGYDLLIYTDANISMRNGLQALLDRECDLENHDMISFRHRVRDCIYDEINVCVNSYKETLANAARIEAFLRGQRYPEHNGLTENAVIVRKNCPEVNRLMDDWFEMVRGYSSRDQLSFNYCLWKRPVRIQILNLNVFDNFYFRKLPHQELTLLPYRLVFEPEDEAGGIYDFHAAADGTARAENGEVRIEAVCLRDTSCVRVYFPGTVGIAVQSARLSREGGEEPSPRFGGFKKSGGSRITLERSCIAFEGDFRTGDRVTVSVALAGTDRLALIREIGEASAFSRYRIFSFRSSASYRLARFVTAAPRAGKRALRSAAGGEGARQPLPEGGRPAGEAPEIRPEGAAVIYFDIRPKPLFKPLFEACGVSHFNHYSGKLAALCAETPLGAYMPASLLFSGPEKTNRPEKIIVFDSFANPRQLNWLCDRYPDARIILWFWNPANPKLLNGRVNPRVEMWTYSGSDSQRYGLRLNTQFFFDCLVPPASAGNGSGAGARRDKTRPLVYFFGRDKSRAGRLSAVRRQLEADGAETAFDIVASPNRRRKNWLYEKTVPYTEAVSRAKGADILLDYYSNPDAGLSLRPMEALFFGKKLITNNRTILDMDFYRPDNVYVLDQDPRSFEEFFACEYKPVPAGVRDRYLLSNWLKRFDRPGGPA